jgi:nitroimidazol reductase NimA-like FMN-containing flavoprotein (pyridoxamine 5'-phosphate oxidase superfamily)
MSSNNYPKQVRRKDRQETDPAFFRDLLNNTASCSIAIQREGYPLNHVAFFVYDEARHEIIFHFSKHGFAGQEIIDDKKTCITVHKYGKLYTAPRAVDFGCEYQSVILYGTIRVLKLEEEILNAMDIFFKKFFAHVSEDTYEKFTITDTRPIHVARVKIEDWFGKQHLVPAVATSSFNYSSDPLIVKQ